MSRISAGLRMHRLLDDRFQVLFGHPGGPPFRSRDDGARTIPKGEIHADENQLDATTRAFVEEKGFTPAGLFTRRHPLDKTAENCLRLGIPA